MTGFGRGECDNGALKIVVEVKAVNHRYSEITVKQPRQFLALEDKMKKVVGEYIERGKVDVFVRTQELADAEKPVQIDQKRALAYHEALQSLAEAVGSTYHADPFRLMTLPISCIAPAISTSSISAAARSILEGITSTLSNCV